ncbi:MAG: phytanoyl-CoA dioxygenase family protein [Planctomycetota bacterium]|jgi:hypothetical protein|nr:phytanoyl-CoA dioxygenase family protein [Planctomycetota bacterium]MDP7248431.1 phytanoyl-CoA dioxygenase family protein [Planctomycetota bacterium]
MNTEFKLTDEQKYIFDLRGWLAIPAVLDDGQIEEMRDFCYRLKDDRDSLPEEDRSSVGGPLRELTDHPIVVDFMDEFVSCPGYANEYCYGFRVDGSFFTIRSKGHNNFSPHGGGGMLNMPGNHHIYRLYPGKVNCGLTRVVWELNPVEKQTGGTLFISGSHKTAFKSPPCLQDPECELWDTYECPAGSVLFFSEAVTHTGALWTNEEWDRVAVFNSYNTLGSKWHKWQPPKGYVESLPPKRQTLFRDVHCQDNVVEAPGASE